MAITHYRIIEDGAQPVIEFKPITGRTHQLRVHAASCEGLDCPILGDPLYGTQPYKRLCLRTTRIHPSCPKNEWPFVLSPISANVHS